MEMFSNKLYREVYKHPFNTLRLPFRTFKRFFRLDPKPRKATVMFIDMCSSVLFKQDYDEVWQENIFYLHEKAKKILKICNGKFSKNIGDCVMCYFTGTNHADNALKCAFSLLEHFMMLKFNFDLDGWDTSIYKFNVSIGVASGDVFFLYKNDPFGWPVDLAARLQGVAKYGQAVIDINVLKCTKEQDLLNFLSKFLSEDEYPEIKSFDGVGINRMTIRSDLEKR